MHAFAANVSDPEISVKQVNGLRIAVTARIIVQAYCCNAFSLPEGGKINLRECPCNGKELLYFFSALDLGIFFDIVENGRDLQGRIRIFGGMGVPGCDGIVGRVLKARPERRGYNGKDRHQ